MTSLKIVQSTAYDFGTESSAAVPIGRHGVDQGWLKKRASVGLFDDFLADARPIPGKTVIHVIAVGDEETYGPNRNFDAFSREDNVTAHRSFKDIGHVYRDHKNDDPAKAVGDVIRTGHNALMSRIELLLALDNDKCRRDVQDLEDGKDLAVSMGSSQEYDVCSYCGHRAPRAVDHCDHIKHQLGQVLTGGQRIYMRNPRPKYFDISIVWKPADRIAYMLRKVAAASSPLIKTGSDLAREFDVEKRQTRIKLARLLKRQLAVGKLPGAHCVRADTIGELKRAAAVIGVLPVTHWLTKNRMLLGPRDFADLIGHPCPACCEAAVNQTSPNELVDDFVSDFDPVPSIDRPQISDPALQDLVQACSMEAQPARTRVMQVVIVRPSKIAAPVDPAERVALASMYDQYKLAFAHYHRDDQAILASLANT